MLTALFRKKETRDNEQEQALEIARTTLMNRVGQVIEHSSVAQTRFASFGTARAAQH